MLAKRAAFSTSPSQAPLLLSADVRAVRTLTFNTPRQLNGWTRPMLTALHAALASAAADPAVAVLVLTGTGRYYCAGVNLAGSLQLAAPQRMHDAILTQNRAVFDAFLDFPKPIIAALNGPAIGAAVTTATLCDAMLMADGAATLSTPFARLAVPPEGCSSVHFARLMGGQAAAGRMLGPEGWVPTAREAVAAGLARAAPMPEELLPQAQALGEAWIAAGRTHRALPGAGNGGGDADAGHDARAAAAARLAEYKCVNAIESAALARAFLGPAFLRGQVAFLRSKGKMSTATAFQAALVTQPLWSRLLRADSDELRYQGDAGAAGGR